MIKRLLNDKAQVCSGFTYVEVLVAFMIFGLTLVFVTRLGSAVYDLNRVNGLENRMAHLAMLEFENYKSGINDVGAFTTNTGFDLDDEETVDGITMYRELSAENVDGAFSVIIEERHQDDNISEVTITVRHDDPKVDGHVLIGQMIKDTP